MLSDSILSDLTMTQEEVTATSEPPLVPSQLRKIQPAVLAAGQRVDVRRHISPPEGGQTEGNSPISSKSKQELRDQTASELVFRGGQ